MNKDELRETGLAMIAMADEKKSSIAGAVEIGLMPR